MLAAAAGLDVVWTDAASRPQAPSVPLLSRSSVHLSAGACAVAPVLPHPRSQWQM